MFSKVLLRFAYSLPCDIYLAVLLEKWTFTSSKRSKQAKNDDRLRSF